VSHLAAITSGFNSRPSAAAALASRRSFGLAGLGLTLSGGFPFLRLSGIREEITHPLEDILVLRQATALSPIGVDDGFVHVDVKQANWPLLDLRLEAEFLLDGGRQTGGRTKETSLVTIDDLYSFRLANLLGFSHEQPPLADF
jgi:hypothetical protein